MSRPCSGSATHSSRRHSTGGRRRRSQRAPDRRRQRCGLSHRGHQLRHGRELRSLGTRRRRQRDAVDHLHQHRLWIPRRRPRQHARVRAPGHRARRRRRRPRRAPGHARLRTPPHRRDRGRRTRLRRIPDRRPAGHRGLGRRQAGARQATRGLIRALLRQRRACGSDRRCRHEPPAPAAVPTAGTRGSRPTASGSPPRRSQTSSTSQAALS